VLDLQLFASRRCSRTAHEPLKRVTAKLAGVAQVAAGRWQYTATGLAGERALTLDVELAGFTLVPNRNAVSVAQQTAGATVVDHLVGWWWRHRRAHFTERDSSLATFTGGRRAIVLTSLTLALRVVSARLAVRDLSRRRQTPARAKKQTHVCVRFGRKKQFTTGDNVVGAGKDVLHGKTGSLGQKLVPASARLFCATCRSVAPQAVDPEWATRLEARTEKLGGLLARIGNQSVGWLFSGVSSLDATSRQRSKQG
jgi:hypothetical protein